MLRPIPGWVIGAGISVMLLAAFGEVWLMLGVGGVLVPWLSIRRQHSTCWPNTRHTNWPNAPPRTHSPTRNRSPPRPPRRIRSRLPQTRADAAVC
ncbi:hypothetical protein [Amycolatopsis speibonae]|uniref:Uncharacterized protein n=1 Tax=Amycolatopsis speibonae TaxID=1450224 RepID=A0ABV7PCX3_9PSEU